MTSPHEQTPGERIKAMLDLAGEVEDHIKAGIEDTPRYGPAEHWFAENFSKARKSRRLSKAEVARRMTERVGGWHPTTVSRVESGDRPVGLFEAIALAEIVDEPLGALTMEPDRIRAMKWVMEELSPVVDALDAIEERTTELMRLRPALEWAIAEARKAGWTGGPITTPEALLNMEPEDAVHIGRRIAEVEGVADKSRVEAWAEILDRDKDLPDRIRLPLLARARADGYQDAD